MLEIMMMMMMMLLLLWSGRAVGYGTADSALTTPQLTAPQPYRPVRD
jgi:hypothetical protein